MEKTSLKILRTAIVLAFALLPLVACSTDKTKEQKAETQASGEAAAESKAGPVVGGDAAAGQAVFQKQCAICHNADSAEQKIGPGLKALFKKKELLDTHRPATEANVRLQIENGNPAKGMPAFDAKLSKAEIDSLIAYLKTL